MGVWLSFTAEIICSNSSG